MHDSKYDWYVFELYPFEGLMIMSNELAGINRIDILEKCIKKLSFSPTELTKEEKDYILTTAALLIKKFSNSIPSRIFFNFSSPIIEAYFE